jgi:hypothetical protein
MSSVTEWSFKAAWRPISFQLTLFLHHFFLCSDRATLHTISMTASTSWGSAQHQGKSFCFLQCILPWFTSGNSFKYGNCFSQKLQQAIHQTCWCNNVLGRFYSLLFFHGQVLFQYSIFHSKMSVEVCVCVCLCACAWVSIFLSYIKIISLCINDRIIPWKTDTSCAAILAHTAAMFVHEHVNGLHLIAPLPFPLRI